ncbi:M14 family zinc carboxypeptidase [Aliagarivorans taiwanensis]|uniref:M14 family zinc carboxypeptidase n=1 Tax=Aliagarivorans taiwanensis TaxID=561966 RepID=UPI0004124014|nr:DUF2817 domain-containing protein [Aliagarivorans taiwanensis]
MRFPELEHLERLINDYPQHMQVGVLCRVGELGYPVYHLRLGNAPLDAPALCLVGGVHGVERIGTQVVLAFLQSLLERLSWDIQLNEQLERLRLYFVPLVNPSGMQMQRRANGNGVDLMRNAPVESDSALWMIGGHRISARLPWYRGAAGQEMEPEAQHLLEFVMQHVVESSPSTLLLDLHSGFGTHDRIWFPLACSKTPIPHLAQVYQLRELFFRSYPHQAYLFEPQALHYCTHGDIWDYAYGDSFDKGKTLIPLTLEMGSWRWLKKNPLQLFSSLGLYHPMKPHRVQRVLRRHLVLMDFLMRAAISYPQWQCGDNAEQRRRDALAFWYKEGER